MAKDKIEELKSNIAMARKRELAFGLCLGKSPETTLLICHKTKDPATLGRMAKKEGETAKIAFGTMFCKSKDLLLTCLDDVPPGLARKAKEMLKAAGMPMKVRILDAAGNMLEDDGDPDEAEAGDEAESAAQESAAVETPAAADGAAAPEAAPDPMAEKWAAVQPRLAAVVEGFVKTGTSAAADVQASWAKAMAAGDAGDATAAMKLAAETKGLVDAGEAARKAGEADRAKWLEASARLRPHLEEALASGLPIANKIRAVWNFTLEKVEGEKPDFAAGLKSISMLVKLIGEANKAKAAAPEMAPAMAGDGMGEAAVAADPVPAAGGAAPPAAAGGDAGPGDAAAAPVAGADPAGAAAPPAAAADPAIDLAAGAPAPVVADLSGDDAAKLARVDTALKAATDLIAAYMALIPSSAEATPAAWTAETTRLTSYLTAMKTPGAALVTAELETALKDIAKLATTINTKTTEKKAWKKALDLFNIRLLTLDHHAQSTQPEIQPKVTDIKTKLAAATAKADTQDFAGAMAALPPLATRCDEVEVMADGCAEYKALLASRQAMVAGTAGLAPTGVASIDGLKAQLNTLLAGAATDAAADKFKDAVKKLDEIPPLETELVQQHWKKGLYDAAVVRIDAVFASISAMPAPDQALLEPALATFKTTYANAKFAVTGDYNNSANLLALIEMKEVLYFTTAIKAVKDYQVELAIFKPRYDLLAAHLGRAGAETYYQGMDADYTQAQNEAAVNKYTTALALLRRSKPAWATEKQRADDCVTYKAKLDALKLVMDPLRAKPGAATGLAQADAFLATAAKQALAHEYGAALVTLAEAEKRAAEAKTAADAGDALGALKDDAALTGIAADFAKAYKVYTDMRANVAGQDTTGSFAAELAKAGVPAAAAQTAAGASPPDFATARTQLDAAIALLEALLPRIMAFVPWQAHLAAAKTAVTTTLPAANTDGCIQTQITEAQTLVTEAEALAAAPGLDIAGAEAKLSQAQTIIDAATADAAQYVQVAQDIISINTQKTLIAAPANAGIAGFLAPRVTVLDMALADIQAAITAKDMKKAAATSAKAAALLAATTSDITSANTALARKQQWFDVNRAKVAAKPLCATLVAAADAKLGNYTTAMTAGRFEAAMEYVKEANWDLLAAVRLDTDSVTFEPIRASAETELNKVKAVRNASVEAEVVALQAKYDNAITVGPAGNYHRATIDAQAVIDAAPALVIKANAFKPYEDARAIARTKLDAALAHAQASAIQPMLTRLTAKYTAAQALATGRDYTAAKTMMEEIGVDADTAVDSANDAATFEMLTNGLDTAADTGFLPSAVIFATQKVLDRLNARPDAKAARTELADAAMQLTAARAGGPAAKAALKAAIAQCEKADEAMSQYRMLEQSVARANGLIAGLKSHAQADYVSALLAPVETAVKATLPAAEASGNHSAEAAKLEAHFATLVDLLKLADGYATYLTVRAEATVEPQVEVLEKHANRYAIKPSIDTMRAKLAEAVTKVDAHQVEDALALLEEVRGIGFSALMMANMEGNIAPTPVDVKAILDRPNGAAELDAMVANLDVTAQYAVLAVAFEVRFDCKLQVKSGGAVVAPGGQVIPNIEDYYELMCSLPPGHAAGNDSLLLFTDDQAGASLYRPGSKEIVMAEGQDEFSGAYGFGRDFEVGGQDDDCKPVDNEPVTRFSWNTLHEVGHAVDDKKSYMKTNGARADHGGWKDYGQSCAEIAQIFATRFNYDAKYIEQVMLHAPSPAPVEKPAADPATPEEWEARRVAVVAHITRAFEPARPWNSNAQAAQLAINGVVYHESGQGNWYSYNLDARKQGMTGYQFRSPAEWFSELYAAYHIGKMKPTHPAAGWLAGLNAP